MADYQKYGNLPTIQILIVSKYKLGQYYQKVKIKNENLLDLIDFYSYPLRDSCPICRAPNCARFIGCYERAVIDEKGNYYKDFPVPRFLCQEKGKAKIVGHRTFSLLHYHLVPYWKYSIPFIIKTLKARHIDGMSLDFLMDYLGDFTTTTNDQYYVELSPGRLFAFQHLIEAAIAKIMAMGYYPETIPQWQTPYQNQRIIAFLHFALKFSCYKLYYCHNYPINPIRGPCGLSIDFYLSGGSYWLNSYFLFGTPSQFRRSSTPQLLD